jgi:hypothetical protein
MSPFTMPSLPKMGTMPRPPRLRQKIPTAPKGPQIYHRGQDPILGFSPFTNPPLGFLDDPHVSATEWMCYLALAFHTGQPKDPWKPPFVGAPPYWVYQKAEEGGRVPGGSVSDFVILDNKGIADIGIRVETERWHIWTTAQQQAKDLYINQHLKTVSRIMRVWDQHFIGDPTGESVMRVMALALRGIELPSPIALGTAQRIRP